MAASVARGLEAWLALALGGSAALSLCPNRQTVDAHAVGAVGEEKVGSQLGKLPAEFKVFHDVKIPGRRANIDHLVIGPTGVFTVETKPVTGQVSIRPDQIYLGSRKKSYVEQAWGQAASVQGALADLLSMYALNVVPILCFTKAELPLLKTEVSHIPLLSPKGTTRYIEKRPRVLLEEQVEALAAAAARELKATLSSHS